MKSRRISISLTTTKFWCLACFVCITAVFLVLFCIPDFIYAGDSRDKALKGVTLDGSKQGQSVGFVDINGDGIDDKIVGAPYASSSSNVGAVLIYKGDAMGGFSSVPSMVLAGDDNYGYTIVNTGDIDGDGMEDFAVGAFNGNGTEVSISGSVTIYKGGRNSNYNKGLGKVIAKLSGEGPMDKFGISISAGDLNNDDTKDLIVGAPFNTNDPSIYQGGAVYIYFAPDFSNRIALHASSSNKGLGWSAEAGDLNGDTITDLCISASGKVLCYYGAKDFNPSLDSPDVLVKSSSAGFGKSIAITGDLNRDGFGEIIIGAPNAAVNGNRDTGSMYIVKGGAGKRTVDLNAPSSDLIVRIDGSALFDRFSASITPTGDVDGDQNPDFAVGAPMADLDAFRHLVGKVYLFKGKDIDSVTTLSSAAVFEGFARDQGYGTSLAPASNARLLIGAPRTDSDTGWVSLVELATGQIVPGGDSGGSSESGDECP